MPRMSDDALRDLRVSVAGSVTVPSDPGYDEARAVWNAMIDVRPEAIVRVAVPADIAPVIAFARTHELPLAVRAGGHNAAGKGTVEGGIVLDLGGLTGVHVDSATRTVRVQGGARLAHVDAATTPHGLAVPLGVISGTGVAGLTLGGGFGWLTRKHGLAADNLVAAELVTADGRTVTASREENPELLWALRGGGGNFGVVWEFTFRAHAVGPRVLGATLLYAPDRWHAAWRALREWSADLPDAMTVVASVLTPPPVAQMGDEPVLMIACAWASHDVGVGEALINGLRHMCPPDDEIVELTPWTTWQSAADAMFPHGVRAYWRNTSFAGLDDDVIEVLVRRGLEQTWVGTAFDVHLMGGVFGRVGPEASPFPARDAGFWINIYGFWADTADDDDRVAFVRGMSAEMEPFATGGHYVNFESHEVGGHRVVDPVETFGPDVYERLVAVKRTFDPDNVFRVNLNIPPG